jgi:PTH2 family peptidyl-tRNA hydrolase
MTDDTVKQLIIIRRDLKMRRGKEIAQGAHASMMFLMRLLKDPDAHMSKAQAEWIEGSFTKVVLQVADGVTLLACYQRACMNEIEAHLVTDNGTTEFGGVRTNTAVAIGPERSSVLDPLFGMLKLY